MDLGITDRVTKPHNCVLAFGIPTSKEGFERARKYVHSSYVQHYANKFSDNGWFRYYNQLVKTVRQISAVSKELGVEVRTDVSSAEFGSLLGSVWHVVILFSHWNGCAVEFCDGFAEATKIVEGVTIGDSGVIVDLSVCQSRSLANELKRRLPHCLIRFVDAKASPVLWLHLYWAVFKHLNDYNLSYLDALEEIAALFLENKR